MDYNEICRLTLEAFKVFTNPSSMRIAQTNPRCPFDVKAIDDAPVYLRAAIGLSINTVVRTAA